MNESNYYHSVIASFKRNRNEMVRRAKDHRSKNNEHEAVLCEVSASTWMKAIKEAEHKWEGVKMDYVAPKKPWKR